MSIYLGDTKISGNAKELAFPLFTPIFQDHIVNNASWLRSDTFSWQSGAVYVSAHNHLVDDIDGITSETETVAGTTITFYRATDGHKIVLPDQESNVKAIYTATGVAWYYILDTTNQRFKLPRSKWNFVGLRGDVGGYVVESLPNITGSIEGNGGWIPATQTGVFYATNVGYRGTGSDLNERTLNFDASRSSSTYQNGAPVQQRATQMYLYFYVGNTIQDETSVDVAELAEDLNGKVDLPTGLSQSDIDFVIERGGTDALWYEIWKSGRLRQGGYTNGTSIYGIVTVNWLKPFSNSNYTVAATSKISDTWATSTGTPDARATTDVGSCLFDKTASYITLQSYCSKYFIAEGWMVVS